MFTETRAAFRRLVIAYGDLRSSTSKRRVVMNETNMTDQQRKHLDAAFDHMDKAFEEIGRALK